MATQLTPKQERLYFEYANQISFELRSFNKNDVLSKYRTIVANLYNRKDDEWKKGLQINESKLIEELGEERGRIEFQKQISIIKENIQELDDKITVINFALNRN